MDDMVGIAARLPAMSEATALRLERALAAVGEPGAPGDQAELIAKRDALLATAEARA